MPFSDWLGYSGNLGFLFGAYWLAQKNVKGFYAQFIANLLYIVQSIILVNNPLFWLSVTLAIFNLYGVYKWNKKEPLSLKAKLYQSAEGEYMRKVADLYGDN